MIEDIKDDSSTKYSGKKRQKKKIGYHNKKMDFD